MTLRARLLLLLTGLLAVALLVSGGLVLGFTRASLLADLDHDLENARVADFALPGGPPRPNDPTGRRFALLLFDRDGEPTQQFPSGFGYAPDPLPQVAIDGEEAVPLNQIVERPAVDNSLNYRVLALRGPQGVYGIFAAPMRAVDSTMLGLFKNLLLVSAIVLGIALLVGWLIVRRAMRPLERVTATAERISAGDLSQRVGVPDDGSEVGRLGHAFDGMLDQIETAFGSQQQALRAKEASEQMLRQFVADASHELRTPLTTVRGYADLHRAGGLADEKELEQAMSRIGSESKRMGTLVEDLLLLARLDQGRPLRQDPVDFSALVDDAVKDMRTLEPNRPMTTDLEPALTITGDEDRLRQVVGNLITNVRVHTPPSSALEVALADGAGSVVLKVADHGPGIDPEHSEHIFDRFYRADAGRSRDRGGSGLGLAIAASVAVAHGGSLEHSATPGGGATFTLTLPRR